MEGEVLASGSRHADNLAPCIYGGLVLIRDTPSLDIIDISTPENILHASKVDFYYHKECVVSLKWVKVDNEYVSSKLLN